MSLSCGDLHVLHLTGSLGYGWLVDIYGVGRFLMDWLLGFGCLARVFIDGRSMASASSWV